MYRTDEEKVELIKAFIRQYAPSIVLGVFLALSGGYAWRAWLGHHNKTLEMASESFNQLLNSAEQEDFAAVRLRAGHLKEEYPHTSYAALGSLVAGQQALLHHNMDTAAEELTTVVESAKLPWMRQIARLRLARVLLEQKQWDRALTTLSVVNDASFQPLIDLLQGEASFGKGDLDSARQHFIKAKKGLPKHSEWSMLLKLRIQDLSA